jgi:hypothetical protein
MFAGRVSIIAISLLAASEAAAQTPPLAVVELFTSQGCSSCPPADALIGELGKDPSLIAVSLPIHYWDYLGWKDTLADPRHTARQKAYSRMRGDSDIFTPQAVINGAASALGSDKAAIKKAVETAREHGAKLSMKIDIAVVNGQVSVVVVKGDEGLSGDEGERSGEVWMWGLASAVPVTIGRGENKGRTVIYANVVRRWVKLGDWPGPGRWIVPVPDVKVDTVDSVAVIVQSGSQNKPGAILGAGLAALQ